MIAQGDQSYRACGMSNRRQWLTAEGNDRNGILKDKYRNLKFTGQSEIQKITFGPQVNESLTAVIVRVPLHLDREMGDSVGGLFHSEPARQ